MNIASEIISSKVDPDANIIFGMVTDPQVQNELTITVIATGFPVEETNRILKLNGPSAVGTVSKPTEQAIIAKEPKVEEKAEEAIAQPVAQVAETEEAPVEAVEEESVPLDMDDAVDEDVDLPPFLQLHRESA